MEIKYGISIGCTGYNSTRAGSEAWWLCLESHELIHLWDAVDPVSHDDNYIAVKLVCGTLSKYVNKKYNQNLQEKQKKIIGLII